MRQAPWRAPAVPAKGRARPHRSPRGPQATAPCQARSDHSRTRPPCRPASLRDRLTPCSATASGSVSAAMSKGKLSGIGNRLSPIRAPRTSNSSVKAPSGPPLPTIARRVHRVDHHALAHRDVLYGVSDRDHLARGLMADRRGAAGGAVNAAYLDIGEIAAADSARFHPHHNIRTSWRWRSNRVEPYVIDSVDVQNPHRTASFF